MFGVLQPPASGLLAEERAALGDLRELLAAAGSSADSSDGALAILRQATADLDSVFLLVVVGEFNAGKSAFVNALLRDDVLREGVTPTTASVTLVAYGEDRTEREASDGLVLVTAPSPILRDLRLVDTPGTNAILRHHERLTQEFVPRSDLVLFITSADRPFTESERGFLAEIRSWGRKVVFALNKIDLLDTPQDLRAQLDFVAAGVRQLLGFEPEVFPVSARRARAALGVAEPSERTRAWETSGFAALEAYLQRTLDDVGRVRLKLLSPLGVAERILADQRTATAARLAVLRDDLRTSEHIDRLLGLYVEDVRRDFEPRLADLENVIRQTSERGNDFFEDTVRLGRIWDLFHAERIRTEFERDVVADTAEQIDRRVQDMIDWLVDQDVRLWRSISSELDRRRRAGADPAQSAVSGPFEVDRRAVLQGVAGRAHDVLQRHDHRREAQDVGTAMREAVTQASLVQAGAVGLGAATVALVSSVAADVTGLLAAGVLAGVGMFILPMRKRRAQAEFRERTDDLRARLTESMREELNRQLDASVQRVRDAVAPYDRFVRAERDRLSEHQAGLEHLDRRFAALRAGIETLGSSTASGTSTVSGSMAGADAPRHSALPSPTIDLTGADGPGQPTAPGPAVDPSTASPERR